MTIDGPSEKPTFQQFETAGAKPPLFETGRIICALEAMETDFLTFLFSLLFPFDFLFIFPVRVRAHARISPRASHPFGSITGEARGVGLSLFRDRYTQPGNTVDLCTSSGSSVM